MVNKKILIVEDSPRNMRLIKMVLKAGDYTLLEAADGEEALEITMREHPDLIMLDIQLPKIDGLEVARRLRKMEAFSQTPIIAVTAYAMKGDMEKVIDAGCDAYLSKPIDTRQLPEVVVKMLRRRQESLASTDGGVNEGEGPGH